MDKIKIPLNRATITNKDADFLGKKLKSGLFSEDYAKEFENKFAKYVGRKYAFAVNSGTSALHLALLALGIKEGDEVICPSYTCLAILNAINYSGAKPRLADCGFDAEKGDFNISVLDIKRQITEKTRAIIVPHMLGYPAKINQITELNLPVIEDATQCLGADLAGKKIGSYGVISIFSLHNSKMISTGQGGILLADSEELIEKAKNFGNYEATVISDRLNPNYNYAVQYNYKMSEIGALLGISQLSQISSFVKKRRQIAKKYAKGLNGVAKTVPSDFENNVFWRFMVETKKEPEQVLKEALNYGIELGRGVYPPLNRYLKIDDKFFPNTKKAVSSLIALPSYPSLSKQELNYIIKVLKEIL